MNSEGNLTQTSKDAFNPEKKAHVTESIIRKNEAALKFWIYLPFIFGLFQAGKPGIPSNGQKHTMFSL